MERIDSSKRSIKQPKTIVTKNRILSHLDMELTERCNNNCIHCYINLPENDLSAKKRELSTGKIIDILSEASSLGCMTVRFTGGEPLLREDFEELYISARKLGIRVKLFTNATLINAKTGKLFGHIPPREKIEVTVYGMKKSSYEKVTRTPGSFEAAWRGIELLLDKKIPFIAKSVILPPNRKDLVDFESWGAKIPWMDKRPSYSQFFDLRCRRDSEVKNRTIKNLRVTPKEGLRLLSRNKTAFIHEMREFCSKFTHPFGDQLFYCGAGVGSCHLDAYGNLQPCLLLRHPDAIYDLKKGSLKNAVTQFFPQLRKKRANNSEYLSRCAKCFLKGLCEQCPAKSWMEHGTMDTPVNYHCKIAHEIGRFIGLLENDELSWEVVKWKDRIKVLSV